MKISTCLVAAVWMLAACSGSHVVTTSDGKKAIRVADNLVIDGDRNDGFRPGEALAQPDPVPHSENSRMRAGMDPATKRFYAYHSDSGRYLTVGLSDNANPNLSHRAEFSAACSVDRMTDRQSCRIRIDSGPSMQLTASGTVTGACLLLHDFPGRTARIRVDNNPMITTNEEGCLSAGAAQRLAAQMRTGTMLMVDVVEWPYDEYKSSYTNIAGGYRLVEELYRFVHSPRYTQALFVPTAQ